MQYKKENCFDYENGFILTSDVYRLGNILAHWELYKKITNRPGDIVEFGVFKANSLVQFATFRKIAENDYSRRIIGFDVFGEFPLPRNIYGQEMEADDVRFIKEWNEETKDEFLPKEEIEKYIDAKKFRTLN